LDNFSHVRRPTRRVTLLLVNGAKRGLDGLGAHAAAPHGSGERHQSWVPLAWGDHFWNYAALCAGLLLVFIQIRYQRVDIRLMIGDLHNAVVTLSDDEKS
jgi:hypothetical protein